ncbi:mitochondrial import inner membrane translocase subunit TIM21 [Marchantia polymorpha subsp. ruderalis]|uniref:Mitochondrial import inner membrane translocase subunit Tim21 n=1 Tax=Marchantia polymorpha TaxID=3197 RepID=A0A2R6W335_MARPO|nr:hypothetical protein MARPO_0168s0006 [Marchantia polymorpha]BBN03661.1 hypothetical protein Mp_2g25270 [Marchantia polymorpha subsp. ruderalis]|eukprot:PTQ28280.1 hypothetical protein MARPO_0168s0006 [Marchantia polymorpha]
MSRSLRNAVKRHSVWSQPGLRTRSLALEKQKEVVTPERISQTLKEKKGDGGLHNLMNAKALTGEHKLLAGTSEELMSRNVLTKAQQERKIWMPVRGKACERAAFILKPEECRTLSFYQGQHIRKSTVKQARLLNQIRFSSPVAKGLAPLLPFSVRRISSQSALAAREQSGRHERSESGITTQEDPFDTLTDKIPERPVSVAEGASYSVVILAGLAVAGAAAYAVFKELIFEPKEYKVFGKALDRVKTDMQIAGRLGSPISGYGQESQNRAARQRISNRAWVDEDGVERVEVMFHIRGPGGAGKVYCEMFKDPEDKTWKYTYLIVDVTNPTPKRFLLESYVPEVKLSPA